MRGISSQGVAARFLIALVMVCLTWNPTRFNYFTWARADLSEMAPIVVFAGLVLLVAWVVFLRATARSLGAVGGILAAALAGSILWILLEYGVVDPANGDAMSWVVLVLFSAVLAAGMSWSHFRRRWAGQVDVDDIDDAGD